MSKTPGQPILSVTRYRSAQGDKLIIMYDRLDINDAFQYKPADIKSLSVACGMIENWDDMLGDALAVIARNDNVFLYTQGFAKETMVDFMTPIEKVTDIKPSVFYQAVMSLGSLRVIYTAIPDSIPMSQASYSEFINVRSTVTDQMRSLMGDAIWRAGFKQAWQQWFYCVEETRKSYKNADKDHLRLEQPPADGSKATGLN